MLAIFSNQVLLAHPTKRQSNHRKLPSPPKKKQKEKKRLGWWTEWLILMLCYFFKCYFKAVNFCPFLFYYFLTLHEFKCFLQPDIKDDLWLLSVLTSGLPPLSWRLLSAGDLVNHIANLKDARLLHVVQLSKQWSSFIDVLLRWFAQAIAVSSKTF